jgi:hypothetical protein
MSNEFSGPQVQLRQQDEQATWEEIDEVLASYTGYVRVFGTHIDQPGMGFRMAGYRVEGQVGLLDEPVTAGETTPLTAHPRHWTQTHYVFEKIEEARHFAARFQDLVAAVQLDD